ncbi:MAG: PEGA domain-containing protein, partial [Deltaproteobacteria bacterium]|nr:PEGA domain-containing protein [Deltaproteobacteria bacterium]
MFLRGIILFFVSWTLLFPLEAFSRQKSILVGHIQAKLKGKKKLSDRDFYEAKLTTAINEAASGYKVNSMGDLASQLEFEHLRENMGCDDQSCLAEIAGATGADYVVFPSLMQRGKWLYFQITYIHRKSASVVKRSRLIKFKWSGDEFENAIDKAVEQVFGTPGVSDRTAVVPGVKEQDIGEKAGDWDIGESSTVLASFSSEPSGAVVLFDGKLLCHSTPCSKVVGKGRHRVSMEKERYLSQTRTITFDSDSRVGWKLTPDFGWLTVETEPAGLDVKIDGKVAGKSLLKDYEVSRG